MYTASPGWRRRALAALLGLLLVFGSSPAVMAREAPSQLGTGQTTTAQADSLQPVMEAYALLLERYAIPLEPAALAAAAHDGLEDAAAQVGASQTPRLGTVGNDPTQMLTSVRYHVQALASRHGDTLSEPALLAAAIRGMASYTDDAHTNYVSPERYQEHLRWRSGEIGYAGIGTRMRGPTPTVVEVFPDSPAERAGLGIGDTLVAVNGQSIEGWRLDEVIALVRGEEGTPLVLAVERAGSGRIEELTVVRGRVSNPTVQSRRVGEFGHVQLRGFPEPSLVEGVERAIARLQAEGVKGIIFDLRGNGGGRVDVGSALLARFVPEGPIYQSVDRQGRQQTVNVQNARPLLTVPLVVLIDEGTASMGEVFAAAVKEHQVGHLIGAPTSGAVAASIYVPLSDGSALQLSIEQVFTGGGAPLDKVGVAPDEAVELDLSMLRQGRDAQMERALEHLRQQAAQPERVAAP